MLSNVLDFDYFLHFFINFDCFFGQEMPKMPKPKKKVCLLNFLLLKSIYIPNISKFYQAVWILAIFFIFGLFWLFFGKKRPKNAEIEKHFFVAFFFARGI